MMRNISPFNLQAFSCPVVLDMTKRIAKKSINRHFGRRASDGRTALQYLAWRFEGIEHLDIGGLVQDCTGLNGRIAEIGPVYLNIGKGLLLRDINLIMDDGRGCSMFHCGVTTPKTYEEAETYRDGILARGPFVWNFDLRYSREVMTIHPNGTFTQNYDLLKELIAEREASQ